MGRKPGIDSRVFVLMALVALMIQGAAAFGASTLNVPVRYATIQAAIDAAMPGDTIVVGDGTYSGLGNVNLDFAGKAVTLRSQNGPATCIIDCGGTARGFYFHSKETPETRVIGFTITNGNAYKDPIFSQGGGIYIYDSSPTIENCVVSSCTGADGGGIAIKEYSSPKLIRCRMENNLGQHGGGLSISGFSSAPLISRCTISGNKVGGQGHGAGINCGSNKAVITNCVIENNLAGSIDGNGGGIYFSLCSPTVTNCIIRGNIAKGGAGNGGGVYCNWHGPTLERCQIVNNTAKNGAGVYCYGSAVRIVRCAIKGNSAEGNGGGVLFHSYKAIMMNSLLKGNSAAFGGAFYCADYSNPDITNCTIVGNTAGSGGPGAYIGSSSYTAVITNCIFWSNGVAPIVTAGPAPVVTFSDIQGGFAGTGNKNSNPLFRSYPTGNLQLAPGSPCIDAGDNAAPSIASPDLNGNPRIIGAAVDMGAYESFDRPLVSVRATDRSASESGNAGNFRISRKGDATVALDVEYSLEGRAGNGVDYLQCTGTATIDAGASYVDVPIVPIDDSLDEVIEWVKMTLVESGDYYPGAAYQASMAIQDND